MSANVLTVRLLPKLTHMHSIALHTTTATQTLKPTANDSIQCSFVFSLSLRLSTRTFFHTRDLLYWMCKTHVRSRTRWVEPNDIYSIPFVVFKQAFVNMEANIGKISTSRIREYTSHDLANPNGQRQSNLMVGSNQKNQKRHVKNGNRRN